ncbi:hypothetical protein MMC07_009625 [Pseudocyphellaria aurata]|nr:hypothetical protein [Pseudocyphellaria aurata]
MATGRDQAHGILELVTQQSRYLTEQWKRFTSDPGKQVAIDGGKQCIEDKSGLEVAPNQDFANEDFHEDFDRCKIVVHGVPDQRLLAKRRKILFRWAGFTIILGAFLGGILGARRKHSATASVTPTQRNIAAIIEASNSEDNSTWSINKTGFGGKNGSAIAAAAVSPPNSSLEISVFYLDVNNLIHDISYSASTGNYTAGTLSAQGYTTMPNSSLSATYDWCSLCANNTTIIAFQDEHGVVRNWQFYIRCLDAAPTRSKS